MNSNSLKFTFKLIFAAFALVLVLSSCGDAPEKEMTSPIQPPPPLSAQELALVVGEINAMIKTDESLIDNFVVQEATPERIEKLFALPEQASYKIRNNALILAGQGSLLSFNKPSDIINKLNAWFPDGVRSNPQGNLKNTGLKLYGPYSGWSDEATAFIMMWRCMPPEIIPLGSTQSSIESRQKFILEQVNFLTKESYSYNGRLQPKTYWDPVRHNDFGHCLHTAFRPVHNAENMPYPNTATAALSHKRKTYLEERQDEHDLGERIAPILQTKFAQFSAANRCTGKGVDDCVMTMMFWSQLSPTDARLAHAIQALEPDIKLDNPLPDLRKKHAGHIARFDLEHLALFDEYQRRAVFLKAKLRSILSAKEAWTDIAALATTLQQITNLQLLFDEALRAFYDGNNKDFIRLVYEISPNEYIDLMHWSNTYTPNVHAAIIDELSRVDSENRCEMLEQWLGEYDLLRSGFFLHFNGLPTNCQPNWATVKQGNSADTLALRNHYLDFLKRGESGNQRETILTQLTDNGYGCFDNQDKPSKEWLQTACKNSISEPQEVATSLKLEHSHLSLNKTNEFRSVESNPSPEQGTQAAWLVNLATAVSSVAGIKMEAFKNELAKRNVTISTIKQWSHPRHNKLLIELQIYDQLTQADSIWPYSGSSWILLVVDEQDVAIVGVPRRFAYQYDDGNIAHVSDLDSDGNLEVWFSGSFGECDGEGSQPGVDCAIETIHMGEISGNTLSYFANTQPAMK